MIGTTVPSAVRIRLLSDRCTSHIPRFNHRSDLIYSYDTPLYWHQLNTPTSNCPFVFNKIKTDPMPLSSRSSKPYKQMQKSSAHAYVFHLHSPTIRGFIRPQQTIRTLLMSTNHDATWQNTEYVVPTMIRSTAVHVVMHRSTALSMPDARTALRQDGH